METIKQFFISSDSPEKISLTIKSLAALAVIFGFDQAVINQAGNDVASIVTAIGMIIAAGTSLIGIGRKIHLGRWSAPSHYSMD